jgi:hypothetical protein
VVRDAAAEGFGEGSHREEEVSREMIRRRAALLLAAAIVMGACGGETIEASGGQPSPTGAAEDGREATCSAAGLSADLPEQPGLPAPVAETRRAIAEVAAACDYEVLEALALSDGTFTYSFGEGEGPAAFWRDAEGRGEEPLALLVLLLDLPHVKEDRFYTWPSAAGARATDEAWESLKAVFTEEEIDQWRRFGAYLGYRVGITAGGDWAFYVAGD